MFAPNGFYCSNTMMGNTNNNVFGYNQNNQQLTFPYQQQNSYLQPPPGLGISNMRSSSQQQQQNKVVGGVCEVLDYEISHMTHFVVEHSLITCGKIDSSTSLKNGSISDDNNGISSHVFKKGCEYVLSATRLPKITIYMALNYLHNYIHGKYGEDHESFDYDFIYQNLVVSLILANKFNDDKMFANKTWATASGIDLKILNKLEIDFLKQLDYNLNDVSFTSCIEFYDEIFQEIVSNLTFNNNNNSTINGYYYQQMTDAQPASPGVGNSYYYTTNNNNNLFNQQQQAMMNYNNQLAASAAYHQQYYAQQMQYQRYQQQNQFQQQMFTNTSPNYYSYNY
ncbi:hypothetical protein HANVADRAFT_1771 [Hanseniaspora valbyensis NRRL Y-1626]|uniref:Cyclin-domain-containing protein n=1 Tax=Hanseniaspora valbyensis NRRL Y-1626 TaxID=766949 RepID=A0A1B7TFY9_9ASCO|nr:hypothetical protein HANVADRAFT_1771 [Hanseniaspora valbyensis NRRL Y-1626]